MGEGTRWTRDKIWKGVRVQVFLCMRNAGSALHSPAHKQEEMKRAVGYGQ